MKEQVRNFLEERGKGKTFEHCANVADTCMGLARRFGLGEENAFLAGMLHDVSAFILPADMMVYANENGWEIDEAERRYPFLLHGRMSAVVAEDQFGVTDRIVLEAITCHSTLRANPTAHDMALFLADKLSWDQDGEPPFLATISKALEDSLERASLAYIEYVLSHGMVLYPHRWLLEAKDWLIQYLKNV